MAGPAKSMEWKGFSRPNEKVSRRRLPVPKSKLKSRGGHEK